MTTAVRRSWRVDRSAVVGLTYRSSHAHSSPASRPDNGTRHAAEVFGLGRESLEGISLALDLVAVELITDDCEVDPRAALAHGELRNKTRAGWLEMTSDKLKNVAGILEKTQRKLAGRSNGGRTCVHSGECTGRIQPGWGTL